MKTNRYCFCLDLKDDEKIISAYERYHHPSVIWPEIIEGIKECNILEMDIYRAGNRLFMILETNEYFNMDVDFNKMLTLPRQKEWSDLMAGFQQRLSFASPGEQWVLMNQIFDLNAKDEKFSE